jgi:hypothetical protein
MDDFESLDDAIKLLTNKRGALTGPDSHVAWLILDSAAARLKADARRMPLGSPARRPAARAPGTWRVGRRSTDPPGVKVSDPPALRKPGVAA